MSAFGEVEDDFRYHLPDVPAAEDLEKYIKGGLHPTHLRDVFDARYTRTNWALAASPQSGLRETRPNSDGLHSRLLQLSTSLSSLEHIPILAGDRRFHVEGPNGRHLCLVLPVLGPSGSELSQGFDCRLRPAVARQASFQAVESIAKLHSQGYCHGDATTANFCFGLKSLDQYSEKDIFDIFGEPETAPVETSSGEIPGPEAPRYIVKTLDFLSSSQNLITDHITLIDIDQSFPVADPPKEMLGTPLECTAPEIALGFSGGPASDVWALGCTLFRLRSGDGLFSGLEVDSPANLLTLIRKTIGDLPEVWQQTLFDYEGQPTKDPTKGELLLAYEGERPIRDLIDQTFDEPENQEKVEWDATMATNDYLDRAKEPFPSCFTDLVWRPAATEVDSVYLRYYSEETTAALEKIPKIDKDEADLFYDLLKKIFVYEPEHRITAEQMLDHPWFRYGSEIKISGKRKREDTEAAFEEDMPPGSPVEVSPEET